MTDLGVLPGDEDSGAAAINSHGVIVGSSGRTDPETYETALSTVHLRERRHDRDSRAEHRVLCRRHQR